MPFKLASSSVVDRAGGSWRRGRRLFAVLLVFGLMTAACADDDGNTVSGPSTTATAGRDVEAGEDEFVIGAVFSQTGNFAQVGNSVLLGVEAAIEVVNREGGILGRPVRLEIRDTASDVNRAVLATRDLLDNESIDVIIPDTISVVTLGIIPVTTDAGVLSIGPSAAPELGDPNSFPFHFVAGVPSTALGEGLARGVEQVADSGSSVGFLTQNSPALIAQTAIAMDVLTEAGYDVVANEEYAGDATDLQVPLQRAVSAGADVVVLNSAGRQAPLILTAAQSLGYEGPVIGSLSTVAADLVTEVPNELQSQFYGVVTAADIRCGEAPDSDLARDVAEIGDVPGNLGQAMGGYNAVFIIRAAIEAAGSSSAAEVRAVLESSIEQSLKAPGLAFWPNPGWGYTAESHHMGGMRLPDDYWTLMQISEPVDGAYEGAFC